MRGVGVTGAAKRRQRASRPWVEPRKEIVAEADGVEKSEGSTRRIAKGPDAQRSAGVREHGMGARGLPRNLGEPVVSAQIREGTRNSPRPAAVASKAAGANTGRTSGTAASSEYAKASGKDERQSDGFVVPMKAGQRPMRPAGGKGATENGTVGGNDGRDTEP